MLTALGVVQEEASDTTVLLPMVQRLPQRLSQRLRGDLQRSMEPLKPAP